jgi:protein-S-isoprenylcysteine O-methyltransferase Ste14
MRAGMAWALPRALQHRIDEADPTGVPASAIVAAVLVILFLVGLSLAVQWSVDGIGRTEVATAPK